MPRKSIPVIPYINYYAYVQCLDFVPAFIVNTRTLICTNVSPIERGTPQPSEHEVKL